MSSELSEVEELAEADAEQAERLAAAERAIEGVAYGLWLLQAQPPRWLASVEGWRSTEAGVRRRWLARAQFVLRSADTFAETPERVDGPPDGG